MRARAGLGGLLLRVRVVLSAALFAVAAPVAAQQLPPVQWPAQAQLPDQGPSPGVLRSPVLTIDADRLFAETRFGARVRAEVTAAADALAAENRRIEAELQAEVDRLTQNRPTMDPEVFRTQADAFDLRVQAIRQTQDAKEAELTQALTTGREAFLAAATPVLGQLMIENGAVVILDRRTVFLGVGLVDITEAAITVIDATLGDGLAVPEPEPEPAPEPAPEPDLVPEPQPDAVPDAVPDTVPDLAPNPDTPDPDAPDQPVTD